MFPVQEPEKTIIKIKTGDDSAREDFLEKCRPFVYKIACRVSKRVLEWGRDDELAVALIAFNEAIDRYRVDSGVPFPAYARMVIGSRLTDYFRKESRINHSNVPLTPNGEVTASLEYAKAWEVYWEEKAAEEREEEIKEYSELLESYGVTFEDLVKCSPRHGDTRQNLMRAAWSLVEEDSLLEELKHKKKLPLVELEKSTGIRRKNLERGRKYIIAMALLISRREEFLYLSSYLRIPSGFEGDTNGYARNGC